MKSLPRKIVASLALLCAWGVVPADAATDKENAPVITATIGLGYDSNAYLSPKSPYIDLAQPGNPLIVPKVQSGLFVPIGLDARRKEASGMEWNVSANGDLYVNSALSNATSYDTKGTLGWNSTLDNGAKFYWGFLGGYHRQIYFDRDTGEAKLTRISRTNISTRYNHLDVGVEAKLDHEVDDVEYKLDSKLAYLSYSDPIVIAPLDHVLFELGGSARFPMAGSKTKLKLGYDLAVRKYTNRAARDATGVQSAANGLLTYYYHTGSVQLFHKFSRNFMTFIDYEGTYRIDNFVNYNNYFRNRVKLRLLNHLSPQLSVRIKFAYTNTSYPNAFAFNTPAGGQKKYTKYYASIKGEYELMDSTVVWIKANYTKQNSSDLRYVYNRTQALIGGDWKF